MKDVVGSVWLPLEREIASEKGDFAIFGLFLREDAPDRWDLIVAAPWISANKQAALKYLGHKISTTLSDTDLVKLSRIVILDKDDAAFRDLTGALECEHSLVEFHDVYLNRVPIKHAYIITLKQRAQPRNVRKRRPASH